MTVIDEVYIERSRQINVEGFTAEHDDKHTGGALASAALCYIYDSTYFCDFSILRHYWPWEKEWWKPSTPRRNLIKAAALIVAEIERLDRMEKKL